MVGRDTVTFKFRLDAKEMQRLIKALEADASRFGAKMTKVGNDAQNAGRIHRYHRRARRPTLRLHQELARRKYRPPCDPNATQQLS